MNSTLGSLGRAVTRGVSGESLILSASLAYATLLAIVPLVTVMFSVLSMFPMFSDWALTVESFVFRNFVPASGEVINSWLAVFRSQAGGLTALGLITLLATSLMLLASIENALNTIWGVAAGRSLSQRLLVYWTLLTLAPILIVASLALSSYILASSLFSDVLSNAGRLHWIVSTLPFLFEWLAFTVFRIKHPAVPCC